MKIRNLIQILSALLVLVIIGFAFAFSMLKSSADNLNKTNENRIKSYLLAYELRQSSEDLTRLARTHTVTGDPEFKRQYYEILDIRSGKKPRPQAYHRVYWDLVSEPEDKPRPDGEKIAFLDLMQQAGFTVAEFQKLAQATQASNALVALEEKGMDSAGSILNNINTIAPIDTVFGKDYHQYKAQIMQPIDEFFVLMEERTVKQVELALNNFVFAKSIFVILFILALLLIAAVVYLTILQNRKELKQREIAQQLAEDENEKLNNSVINILQAVNLMSKRDLTVKAPVTEDIIGTVSDSINALSSATVSVLHRLTATAKDVSEVSSQVQSQADVVSRTAKEERANVAQMLNSLDDTTKMMNQVSSLASESSEAANQVTVATDKALDSVNETVMDMESIRQTISESEKKIKRLGESSQEITSIVNLINTISERTHVLSLNASMQAAVAGEAGRGFAVVAEEVQRLAESSRAATEQITALVHNIQIETSETINTVNRTIDQVIGGSKQAQKAGEQMMLTKNITADLVKQVREIANASDRQKDMSKQLVAAVKLIGESTDETAEQIAMQNEGTAALQQAAEELVASISVFKLPERISH